MAAAVPYLMATAAVASAGSAVYSATRGTPKAPAPPKPPTQDTAANAALQEQKDMLRRRGVLSNIYAGGNAPTPTTSGKQMLGN